MKNLDCLKTLFLTVVLSGCASDALTSSDTTCAVVGVEEGDVLNIRSQPDPRSETVDSIPHDETAVVKLGPLKRYGQSDWVQIRYGEVTGWVNAKYIYCRLSPEEAEKVIAGRAHQVVTALRNRDMAQLSQFIHPTKGVRFSPYGYVDVAQDLIIRAEDLSSLLSETNQRTWGAYDGSGDPIDLTFEAYYDQFVYDRDFADASRIAYNTTLVEGTTRNNSVEVYPQAIIVEYYSPGVDPKYEGMDWSCLRLAFEELDGEWYVVGVIHDQWTI